MRGRWIVVQALQYQHGVAAADAITDGRSEPKIDAAETRWCLLSFFFVRADFAFRPPENNPAEKHHVEQPQEPTN